MASEKKRRRTFAENNDSDNMSDSSEDNEDSDNEDNILNEDVVEVEFEARVPDVKDEHGIKKLLNQLFLKASINLTDLTDLILEQNYIGNVIKQSEMPQESDEEDSDIFGVISVVNINDKKHRESIQQLRNFLLAKCRENSDDNLVKRMQSYLDGDSQIGFIFSERFLNMPPNIAVPSYESLRQEIEVAIQKKLKFNFDHFFIISKIYKPLKSRRGDAFDVIYSNAEEEFLESEAEFFFDYSVAQEKDVAVGGSWDGDEDVLMEPHRRLIVFTADKLNTFIEKMRSNFSNG